jgi:hypothetical protein
MTERARSEDFWELGELGRWAERDLDYYRIALASRYDGLGAYRHDRLRTYWEG